jgi:hypothetical protein
MATETDRPKSRCMVCGKKEGGEVKGSRFHAEGENGMQLLFWLCDPCAIKNGPDQGPIDLEDPTTRI